MTTVDNLLKLKLVEHPCYDATRPGDILRQRDELQLVVSKLTRVEKGDGYTLYVMEQNRTAWVTFGAVRSDFRCDIDDVIVARSNPR